MLLPQSAGEGCMNYQNGQIQSAASLLGLPTHVGEVMTRQVMTLRPDDSFGDAVNLMATQHVRHSVVIDGTGRIQGVISDRDVLRALARIQNWQSKPVSEIMTPQPVVVRQETPLTEAVGELLLRRINCLPVVLDNGTVCGILTSTDLLKSYQQVLEAVFSQER
jgi:CBS domain-containing protein